MIRKHLESLKHKPFEKKVQIPLMVLAAVIVVSFIANFIFTTLLSSTTVKLAKDSLPGLDYVMQADRDLYQAQMAERSLIFVEANSPQFAELSEFHSENITQAKDRIASFRDNTLSASMKEQAERFLASHQEWENITRQIQTELASGTAAGKARAIELSFGAGLEKFDGIRDLLDVLGEEVNNTTRDLAAESQWLSVAARLQQLLLLAFGLTICFITIRHFPRMITGPVKNILESIRHVTLQGDFNHRLTIESRDEIGELAEHVNQLLASLEQTLSECNTVASGIARGNFEQTVKTDSKGHLKDLATSINKTSQAVRTAMKNINTITSELAAGNLGDYSGDKLPGEYADTIQNAAKTKELLRDVISETNNTLQKIADGDFSYRIQRDFPGELDGLKTGITVTQQALANVFRSIEVLMQAIRDGHFDSRSNTKLKGQYADMVQLIEHAMSHLDAAIEDISRVMADVVSGKLNSRVTLNMEGDLNRLKQNINHSLTQSETINSTISASMTSLANGDLSTLITTDFPGDYAMLKNDINRTVNNLKDMIGKIQHSSDEVLIASQQLTQSSADISNRTEQQAAAVEQTLSTLASIRDAGSQGIAVVKQVDEVCNQTGKVALEGEETMQRVISSVENISESSNKIGSIIGVIDEIAFQTNLLALNAAVEAARAGETGRGFAVVAGEVRSLAQRSANAAKEIKGLVQEIIARVQTGTEVAQGSGKVLQRVVTSFQEVNAEVKRIAQVIENQTNSVNEITGAMKTIENNTQATAAVTEQSASSSEAMSNQASDLRRLTTAFKL